MKSPKSLKAACLPWLVSLVAFDILVIFVFVFPDTIGALSITQLTVARATVALVLPVAVLLLSGLLSHQVKASLVYWKLTNALPAHAAFNRHAPADARIDMAALRKRSAIFRRSRPSKTGCGSSSLKRWRQSRRSWKLIKCTCCIGTWALSRCCC